MNLYHCRKSSNSSFCFLLHTKFRLIQFCQNQCYHVSVVVMSWISVLDVLFVKSLWPSSILQGSWRLFFPCFVWNKTNISTPLMLPNNVLLYIILGYHTTFYYLRVRFSSVCFTSFWFPQSSCNHHQIDHTWLANKNNEHAIQIQTNLNNKYWIPGIILLIQLFLVILG